MDDYLDDLRRAFHTQDAIVRRALRSRETRGLHDLHRGALYEEVIAADRAFRRAATVAYGVEDSRHALHAVQPNYGANGCIDTILSFVRERDRGGGMLIAAPTYVRYLDAAKARGIEVRTVRSLATVYPVDQMIATIRTRAPSVLVVITPNNPTGTLATESDLIALRSALPAEAILVIDRTCASLIDSMSSATLLRRLAGTRTIILHSLSKYFVLSHVRFGFALHCDHELGWQMRHFTPLGTQLEGALIATAALEAGGPIWPRPDVLDAIRATSHALGRLEASSGFEPLEVTASFAVLRLPHGLSSAAVARELERRGILVLGSHEFAGEPEQWVRIHAASPASATDALVDALHAMGPA